MDSRRLERRTFTRGPLPVAVAAIVLVGGCGSESALLGEDPSLPGPSETTTVLAPEGDSASSIEIVVVLPSDWPNPIYPGRPGVVIEGVDGEKHESLANDDIVTVQLPRPGDYSVGAVIEDGGCHDTAGMAQSGNPPVAVSDGDVFELRDTGEICE